MKKQTNLWVRHLVAALTALLMFGGGAGGAAASDFSSNISFSFADDNLLKDAGETRKNSPNAYFGQVPSSALDRLEPSQFRRSSSLLTLKKPFEADATLSPEGRCWCASRRTATATTPWRTSGPIWRCATSGTRPAWP